jgi:hypothetical protein
MAFLLAVTMGMASDRFDARRTAVVTEANAIESSYFQAPYLSGSAAVRTQDLLREYLSLRIVSDDTGELAANLERSVAIQAELWSTLAAEARTTTSPDLVAAFGDSLAELVNVGESRVTAGIYARVPETVLILLLAGSAFALGMVGYSAGIAGQRSIVSAVVLVIALGAVLMLVIDIDRPQQGLIRVSQQPLLDVQGRIGLPSP